MKRIAVCQVGSMETRNESFSCTENHRHFARLRSYLATMLVLIGTLSSLSSSNSQAARYVLPDTQYSALIDVA